MKSKLVAFAASLLGLQGLILAQSPDLFTAHTKLSSAASLPLTFEPNRGQTDPRIKFMSRGDGYSLFLTSSEADLTFIRAKKRWKEHSGPVIAREGGRSQPAAMIRMHLEGASESAIIRGESPLPGKVNYIAGSTASDWHTNIETYGRIRYESVYPGVDLVYHGEQGRLEYDFLVSPGANANQIGLRFNDINGLKIDPAGNLILSVNDGSVVFHKPVVYQETSGKHHPVKGTFHVLAKNTVGFSLGRYDHSKTLIIDPVLAYSTYLGGGFFDAIAALTADQSGNVYVTGVSDSCNFPTTEGTFEPVLPSCLSGSQGVIFVSKLNPSGSALVYSTFITDGSLGAMGTGSAIAVDASGNVYVAGQASLGFPVTPGVVQPHNNTNGNGINAIVFKLDPTGATLLYSTYLGGSFGGDAANAIAIDSSGNAFVAGTALSTDFPVTPGAFQTTDITPGEPYSWVAKLNPTGTALVYSTYLLGDGTIHAFSAPLGEANGIAVDSQGNVYVVGGTADEHFPVTAGAFQTNFSTDPTNLAIFRFTGYITKFDPTGASQVYSSFLGGSFMSEARAVAVDSAGNAYVTGWTDGGNVISPGAFQSVAPGHDAYVVKVNPSGSALTYSTYLGGTCLDSPELAGDEGRAIALDAAGNAYIAGQACSKDFPATSNAFQTTLKGTFFNPFLSVLNPSGSGLLFSTYVGGSSFEGDWANGIGLDGAQNVYIGGLTHATDFPTTAGAFQLSNKASDQGTGFISKLSIPQGGTLIPHDFTLALNPSSVTISNSQTSTTLTLTPTPGGFYENVSFSCSGLPAGAVCNFSSLSVIPGTTASTTTVTVTGLGFAPTAARARFRGAPLVAAVALLGLLGWRRRRAAIPVVSLTLLLGVLMFSGCGGGGGGNGGSGGSFTPKTFTVTIAGSSQSANHTVSFNVTVQ